MSDRQKISRKKGTALNFSNPSLAPKIPSLAIPAHDSTSDSHQTIAKQSETSQEFEKTVEEQENQENISLKELPLRSFNILERASIFRPQETIQRQDTASLPEIPNYQLTTPSLLQPPEPSSRYSLGVDSQLELDPEILAMAELLIQQQMELAAVRAALSQVNLLPSLPGLESTAPNPFSLPPTPQSPPLVPPGEDPDTPRSGTTGDLMSAVLAIPTIDSAIASLQTQALAQLSGNWRQLSTPEQALVSSVVVIASSALAGVLTNPSAREFALSQLNGRVIPVPGLDWLHLELNTESDNLMMGLHVDVGSLLPSSLGFGSSSTEPIGAPPSPEPFVPGQSVQRKELVEPKGKQELSPLSRAFQRQVDSRDRLPDSPIESFNYLEKISIFRPQETIQRQEIGEGEEEEQEVESIQTKLTVGEPGDKYEQEADTTAAKVMAMSDEAVQRNLTPDPSSIMETEEELQTKAEDNNTQASSIESRLGSSKGGGNPLPDDVRGFMEPRFGGYFGDVRVHTDSSAVQMNQELSSQAFAHGNDIYYGAGKSPGNDELTAHELTHTIQQTGNTVQQKSDNNKQKSHFQLEENEKYIQAKQISALTFTSVSNKNSFQTQEQQEETAIETTRGQAKAEQAVKEIDPAEREKKKAELIAKKQPEVEQKKQQLDQVGQKAQQASQKTEKPSKPKEKTQAQEPPKKQKADTGAAAQAQQAEAVAQQAFAQANSQALPEQPTTVVPPEPVTPVDSGGMPLPGNPEADAQISNLAQQAQSLRDGGHQLLAQAAQIRTNAQIIRGNIQLVKEGIGQSEQGVATSTEHLTFRQESVEQAKQALQVSEQKAFTVAEQAPGFVDKSNQGQEKTQPMVSEANELAGESAAKTPDDPEAAGKSQEQGQKLNQVASDTATMDEAFTQTRTKAESLVEEVAQAQEMNTQTSTQIGEIEATLGQSQERLTQMGEQNQQALTQAESLEGKPDEMLNQAAVLEEKGQALIQASMKIEQQLQQIQAEYQQAMSSVPAAETGEQTGGSETGVIQRDVEEGRYSERENIDLVGGLSELAPWLTGVDLATEEQRQAAAEAAEARRQEQIAQINEIAGGSFENLSAGQKMGISLQLMGENIYDSLSNIQWPDWRKLALSLIDPRTALTGVLSGLSQILSGGANLLSGEQWSKDPLGNFLKSAADIATGLTIILGSITALAAVITAIMGAITLLSLGTAAPVTGPIIAFCATVMTTVGGMTFKVGLVAAALHGLVLIKNLVDAATAETAEDLQNQSEQMTQDVKNAGGALLQAGMGKLAQWGGRHLQGRIAAAEQQALLQGGAVEATGVAFARGMPGRVAAMPGDIATSVQQKVSGARQWLGQRLGRGKPTTSTPATSTPDVGLANQGYRPKPGERSMTREEWRLQEGNRRYRPGSREPNLLDKDKFTKNTQQLTEWRRSIQRSNIRAERRLFLGDNYVKVGPGKWRSIDGTRQFRVKPADYLGEHGIGQPLVPNTPHIHLELLEKSGNKFKVIKNVHIPLE